MMNNFNKNIDKLVSRILNEEIEGKVKELSKKINEGEWTEVEMDEELKGGQKKIDVAEPKGKITSADFKKLRDAKKHKEQVEEYFHFDYENELDYEGDEDDMRKRYNKDMGEAETEEGNAFTGALADAKKGGKDSFEVDGKKFNVKESNIRLSNQMNLASILKNVKEDVKSLKLTENELIDMIEKIVKEQQVKDKSEKNNIGKKEPQGLKDTNKVLSKNKQENDSYAKDVVKKMKDYMKDMFSGGNGYEENPDDFPQSNYDMEKEHNEKKYHPSDAVGEYIEAFAYPGMTNLVYDEIKPDDEMITKQIKGDSKNGNAITGKDGKALGNVSKRSEKVGERFKKNFDENLYGAEQMNVSYKRQPQPVDIAGDKKQPGGLKKGSTAKAEKIMNQLESIEDKKAKIVSEEMNKMKNLISYDRKTQ